MFLCRFCDAITGNFDVSHHYCQMIDNAVMAHLCPCSALTSTTDHIYNIPHIIHHVDLAYSWCKSTTKLQILANSKDCTTELS